MHRRAAVLLSTVLLSIAGCSGTTDQGSDPADAAGSGAGSSEAGSSEAESSEAESSEAASSEAASSKAVSSETESSEAVTSEAVSSGSASSESAGTSSAAAGDGTRTATILYFNDAHEIGPVPGEENPDEQRGGVARLAAAVHQVRADDPDSYLVFGGDLAGGTIFGGLYRGAPMVEAFNTIGVDLANFGQHDFDFGLATTRELVGDSDFDWISSNVSDAHGKPLSPAGRWQVAELGGISVGFIGLTDAIETTSAAAELSATPPAQAAEQAIAEMTAEQPVDVVIAVTQYPEDDNRALVGQVPEIDAAFGEEMAEDSSVIGTATAATDSAPLMAPEGNMGSLIRLDVTEKSGDAAGFTVEPSVIEVDDSVTPDPDLLTVERHYQDEMDKNLSTELATLKTPLLNPDNISRSEETALGNFVADAFRAEHDTDIGWIQGGGLRAEATGTTFTKRDAYAIAPFGNQVTAVRTTGATVLKALEQGVSQVADSGGGFPQVSGLSYSYDADLPVGSRVSDVRVGTGGTAGDAEPIDPDTQYTVALTGYVLGGGDDVTAFDDAVTENTAEILVPIADAPTDAEVLVHHATDVKTIDVKTEGRITVAGR